MATAEYIKIPIDAGFRFNVTPAPKALGGCAGIIVVLVLSLLGSFPVGFVALLVLSPIISWMSYDVREVVIMLICIASFIGVTYFIFKKLDFRKKNHKKPSEFTVRPDALQVDGKTVLKADIHRIIVRNAYEDTPRIELTGQPISTGTGIGIDIRNALERISYSVNVETGGKAIQLAGGLDETTAFGLLTEVKRILEIENQ